MVVKTLINPHLCNYTCPVLKQNMHSSMEEKPRQNEKKTSITTDQKSSPEVNGERWGSQYIVHLT